MRRPYGDGFAKVFKGITSDDGSELSGLADAFKEGGVCFTHPYSFGGWETDEKQNSLERRFIPRGKDIVAVSGRTVQKTEAWINNLRGKCQRIALWLRCFKNIISHIASAAWNF